MGKCFEDDECACAVPVFASIWISLARGVGVHQRLSDVKAVLFKPLSSCAAGLPASGADMQLHGLKHQAGSTFSVFYVELVRARNVAVGSCSFCCLLCETKGWVPDPSISPAGCPCCLT